MIAAAIAKYLNAKGVVVFKEDGPGANCFIGHLPVEPEIAVKLTPLPGSKPPDVKYAYSSPGLQVWVRGTLNPRDSHDLAEQIYSELHNLHDVTLDAGGQDEIRLLLSKAKQEPHHMGEDAMGRHEWAFNLDLFVTAPSIHRV